MSHEELRYNLKSLEELLGNVKNAKHALMAGKHSRNPFSPTGFMYMYATFNTLYNINWSETFEREKIVYYDSEKITQTDMICQMLAFCCNDARWKPDYVETLIKDMTEGRDTNKIIETLKGFELDKPYYGSCESLDEKSEQLEKRGFFKIQGQKTSFINAVKNLLEHKNVTSDNLKKIATTIYGVRCNIFHGVKGFDLMKEPKQEERLKIYTNFLYAISKMVLYYALKEYENKYFVK